MSGSSSGSSSVSSTVEVWLASGLPYESANQRLAECAATHIAWVEDSGELSSGAIGTIEATLDRFDVDILYGDSVQPDGRRISRPIFSPLRLREQDFLGPVVVMSVEWMRQTGGFAESADGAHGYDFALRYDGKAERVVRVPQVLSIDRTPRTTGALTLTALQRRIGATSVTERADGSRRVRYPPVGNPLVSVLIPTRGTTAEIRGRDVCLVVEAVRGLIERTDYRNIEIVVVADDPTPQAAIDELIHIAGDRLRLVRYSDPFNFSAKVNRGAVFARGEYLLLLNDDVEVIEPDWLSTMIGLAQQSTVGIVGSLLLFEDGTVQHGGHVYRESWAGHIEAPEEIDGFDPLGAFGVTREVSGVTAACALISAETFREVGGLSELLPGNYNDADLCLKVRATGKTVVWSPDASLFHFESKTRDAAILPEEIDLLRTRWGTRLLIDQYWSA